MGSQELEPSFSGERFTVVLCDGALESFQNALSSVPKRKRKSLTNRMIAQIDRLANGDGLSKAHFPKEAKLPAKKGKNAKDFYALKRIPIRGYCWFSETEPSTIYISHFVFKDQDRLSGSDTQTVHSNWWKYEVESNEC